LLRSKLNLLILVLVALSGVVAVYRRLPGFLNERQGITQRLFITDKRGNIIRSYSEGESYDWISLEEVPKELIELLILAEDKSYYAHDGIDYKSIARSFWLNLKSGRIVSGASTISQQVYRLGHHIERSYTGKIKTLLGAYKIEQNYSKDQILENYLNTLPYGRRLAGVKRAGEVFFGKDLHLLNLSELATLAVLPRAPSGLRGKTDLLYKKRNQLLDDYGKLKKLIPIDLEIAMKVPVEFRNDFSGWDNYHYTRALTQQRDFPRFVSGHGKVETTLDLELQEEVTAIIKSHLNTLKSFNVGHGAAVVLDNSNGDVLAYVGSQDTQNSKGGHFDALKIKRQPGSALKPLTFALALQKGKKLSDVLPDIPSYYKTGLGQFLPRNYDQSFSGPRLMREALANSLNLPAVALADEVGVHDLYDFYKAMGLSLTKEAHHYGVGMTLGNVEITPLELAEVYTAFARGGLRVKPRFFKAKEMEEIQTPLSEEAAFMISDVLSDKVARREEFGEHNPFDLPFSFSVKTGTSTDFRDNWATGFNRDYTVLVWVGNTDQKPMKRVSGITGAGPILRDIVKFLSKRHLMHPLSKLLSIETHKICALSGLLPGEHCVHTKTELFQKGSAPTDKCKWHQEVLVEDCRYPSDEQKIKIAILPDAYQSWAKEHPEWIVENQIAEICPNEERQYNKISGEQSVATLISKPLAGSIYAIDPNLPRTSQKLKVELNSFHKVKKVFWKVDGKKLEAGTSILNWPMEKGSHSFEADVQFDDGKLVTTPSVEVKVL
jgi:penicillin-binding protein 1C